MQSELVLCSFDNKVDHFVGAESAGTNGSCG